MAVDYEGDYPVGSEPGDIREFLEAYTEDSYPVHDYRQSRCACGGMRFSLWVDEEESSAKRRCADCNREGFIFDGEEYWSGEHAELCTCLVCNDPAQLCNVGIGYSFYDQPNPDDEMVGVKWIYIGVRCTSCHTLGCFGGWKIGSDMPRTMLDQV